MTYPLSLRRKVVAHIEEGMGKREAARLFKISPNTIYQWLGSEDLRPKPSGCRRRKVDLEELRRHVEAYPDMYLRERAAHFGVQIHAIWYRLNHLKISKKKSDDISSDAI